MAEITIGRFVIYTLSEDDVIQINRRRTTGAEIAQRMSEDDPSIKIHWPKGAQAHIGNPTKAGQKFPMLIVRVPENSTGVNGKVFLDGTDELWTIAVEQGINQGQWQWPLIAAVQSAAKSVPKKNKRR